MQGPDLCLSWHQHFLGVTRSSGALLYDQSCRGMKELVELFAVAVRAPTEPCVGAPVMRNRYPLTPCISDCSSHPDGKQMGAEGAQSREGQIICVDRLVLVFFSRSRRLRTYSTGFRFPVEKRSRARPPYHLITVLASVLCA